METTEYSLPVLIHKAEHYAARAEHCIMDIHIKLRQWGCRTEDIDTVTNHLITNEYINERRYAKAFVHDQVAYAGWGRNKIKSALFAKFIDERTISNALKTIDEEQYQKALQKAAAQKKGATREQLLRFLCQRGFTLDEIQSVTRGE